MTDGNNIDQAAALWVVRNARGLNSAERSELLAWRRGDPRHNGSYLRALAIDRLASRSRLLENSHEVVSGIAEPVDEKRGGLLTRRRFTAMALAAGVATFFAIGFYWSFSSDDMSTKRGEIRNIAMADGSTAILGPESAISVEMRPQRRSIGLESGRAWFEVAHDRTRPFEVRYDDMIVRATGTAFEVNALPNGVEVVVTEGSVDVLKDGSAKPVAHLILGDRMFYVSGAQKIEKLNAMAIQQRLLWREGMIVLDGKRLIEAVDEVNRYNMVAIRVTNPALAEQRIFGTFRTRDPEGLARAVATALGAKVSVNKEIIDIK